jgi:hypothetical protein
MNQATSQIQATRSAHCDRTAINRFLTQREPMFYEA